MQVVSKLVSTFRKPIKIQYNPINEINGFVCGLSREGMMALQLTHLPCTGKPKWGDDKTTTMPNVADFSINFAPYVTQAKDYYITLSLADVMKDLLNRHNVLKATKDKVLNYN